MKTRLLMSSALLALAFSGPVVAAEKQMSLPPCLATDEITNTMTPPELYMNAQTCLKEKDKGQAALLFFMATTYAAYDFGRVENPKKVDMLKELGQKFSSGQTMEENNEFGAFMRTQMSAPPTMYPLCQKILNIGPPMYAPDYLLDPDLAAGQKGYQTDLNIPLAWLTAVGMATTCSVKNLQLDKNYKP